jgi:hypothetical protein
VQIIINERTFFWRIADRDMTSPCVSLFPQARRDVFLLAVLKLGRRWNGTRERGNKRTHTRRALNQEELTASINYVSNKVCINHFIHVFSFSLDSHQSAERRYSGPPALSPNLSLFSVP